MHQLVEYNVVELCVASCSEHQAEIDVVSFCVAASPAGVHVADCPSIAVQACHLFYIRKSDLYASFKVSPPDLFFCPVLRLRMGKRPGSYPRCVSIYPVSFASHKSDHFFIWHQIRSADDYAPVRLLYPHIHSFYALSGQFDLKPVDVNNPSHTELLYHKEKFSNC